MARDKTMDVLKAEVRDMIIQGLMTAYDRKRTGHIIEQAKASLYSWYARWLSYLVLIVFAS
jgi:hypothetical protein